MLAGRGVRPVSSQSDVHAPRFTRVILLVIDSAGIGELPDAAAYGDEGSDTLGNIAREVGLRLPFLRSLGLGQLVPLGPPEAGPNGAPRGAFGRMAETSPGKDSVTGHWEIAGVVLDRPFPTFPSGFPAAVIEEFERRIGRATLGNVVASGTEIIDRLGAEHVRTGKPIVYTSADSVFQVAAHEDVIPIAEQYRICETAFDLVGKGMGVGRVIARPFVGAPGAFTRTANRHDYALEPSGTTLLDAMSAAGQTVVTVGKVRDLFAGRGVTHAHPTVSDADGLATLRRVLDDTRNGLVFVNLVDSDTQYGHRNDPAGYAANLERIDAGLIDLAPHLRADDLFVVTADHGNDPTTPSTDHSREYVPLLVFGHAVPPGRDLGTRATYADLGQTLAENFGVGPLAHGTSFLGEIATS
jgi:phosphopentomutase